MALTVAYSNTSLSPFQNNITEFVLRTQTAEEGIYFHCSTSFTAQEISEKARQFIHSLYLHSFLKTEGWDLEPLHEIFNRMACEQNEIIKQALSKPSGCLSRLFSTESWEEWLETKTPLGKVVDV